MSGLIRGRPAWPAVLLIIVLVSTACNASNPSPSPSASPSPSRGPAATATPTGTPPPPVVDLTGTSYKPEAGVDGGSIVIGDSQEAFQFNPYFLGPGAESAVASAAWAALVTVTPDQRYLPDLATTVPTVDNGAVMSPGEGDDAMTVTWTLRDGLTWSDGEPLTCDDFKYTWQWVLDDANFGAVTAGYEDIKDVECTSDTELVWHFERIYEGYLTLVTAPLPRHHLEPIPMDQQAQGVGFRLDELAKLPVSGPFTFASVAPGSDLKMVRNPNYKSPRTGKPAHLESVTFRWYADPVALVAGYRRGEVDVAAGLSDIDLPDVADLGAAVSTRPSPIYELLRPNWSAETCSTSAAVAGRGVGCPMADPAIRAAIATAIDRSAIAARVLGAAVLVPATNVDPAAWFFTGQAAPAFDPAEAERILDEAGWKDLDADGVREKDGLEARIEVCTIARQARLDTVGLVAGWLKDIGIAAVTREAEPDDMFADFDESDGTTPCAVRRGNFDIALHSLASSIDPQDFYFRYHSSQFEPDGQNQARIDDVGIDVALETVTETVNPAVIKDAMVVFQELYVERTVEIPLYFVQTVELHAPKVGNFAGRSPTGGPTWNAADWFVKR